MRGCQHLERHALLGVARIGRDGCPILAGYRVSLAPSANTQSSHTIGWQADCIGKSGSTAEPLHDFGDSHGHYVIICIAQINTHRIVLDGMGDMMEAHSKEQVGARLKQARKRIFATAKEAADALEMKDVTVRAHEAGRNGVSYYDLERYARRYGVAQMWLLTGKGQDEPSTDFTSEIGEFVYVSGWVDDNSWFPANEGQGGDGYVRTDEGYAERVSYTDPRFPEGMVEAFKVRTSAKAATYIDGTIIFCVDRSAVPIGLGDHVIVVRTRGEFDNVSARVIDVDRDGVRLLRSLTSDSPPIRMEETSKEDLPHISALIVGSLTRRPAPKIGIEEIKRWEQDRAGQRRMIHEENSEIAAAYWAKREDEPS
ncbi:helix-turn-helix domain-containing protein [Brevundimonas vitis]|uniref:Helix-turn-helix domain-containing protein n=1 Tax=Brevundimonas vitisensis TaxID=2800818 RepID=A0ABX7BU53_9CAUL|nr:helix-turn-helix domain-containing protein [Brevundimonas vitisensis]QQQ19816.1 helix-turn-helix domain-containing protein [Brevundimonas vitisensis]